MPVEPERLVDWVLRGGTEWFRMVRQISQDVQFNDEQLQRMREYRSQILAVIQEQQEKRGQP